MTFFEVNLDTQAFKWAYEAQNYTKFYNIVVSF